jgi:hypothetical protein
MCVCPPAIVAELSNDSSCLDSDGLQLWRWHTKVGTRAEFEANALACFQREVGFRRAFFSVRGLEASPTVSGLETAAVRQAIVGGESYAQELLPVKRAALLPEV